VQTLAARTGPNQSPDTGPRIIAVVKRATGARPTIRDVAKLAGVSTQTVSNVINDRPVTRPETRRRVEVAIRELGYERDALARALRLRRTHALGFLMEDQSRLALQDPAHASLLTGMVERSRHHEYTVTVYVSSPDAIDRYVSTILRQQRVAGLFLSLQGPEGKHAGLIERLAEQGVPMVLLEQRPPVPGVCAVTSDNEGGGRAIARHLLELGHRRLAILTGTTPWPGGERRFHGFLDVTAAAGLEVPIWRSPGWAVEAARATMRPLLAGPRPTAVFAANDVLAVGVLRAAEDVGLDVPRDLSVAGFDDFDFATMVRPSLTTVRIDFAEMGEWAAEALITIAEGGEPAAVVTLPTTLLVRESTASPPPEP
jgi:DNA-binding LacI/PurR family transcriptional regulator